MTGSDGTSGSLTLHRLGDGPSTGSEETPKTRGNKTGRRFGDERRRRSGCQQSGFPPEVTPETEALTSVRQWCPDANKRKTSSSANALVSTITTCTIHFEVRLGAVETRLWLTAGPLVEINVTPVGPRTCAVTPCGCPEATRGLAMLSDSAPRVGLQDPQPGATLRVGQDSSFRSGPTGSAGDDRGRAEPTTAP